MKKLNLMIFACAAMTLAAGCNSDSQSDDIRPIPVSVRVNNDNIDQPRRLIITPQAIPGTPRVVNNDVTGGYAPSNVQAQLKIDVRENTREVKVIRDNTDPYVITKPYVLAKADPYAVRGYLEAAVGAKSVNASPAQATAVKFSDGSGVVLVSAEEYRFHDSDQGRGIDSIVAALDRSGLTYAPDADTYLYFPRISRAANLRDMLIRVGSSDLDPEFAVSPSTILVDAELNALLVRAPRWEWGVIRDLLRKYDRVIPEIKITYRVLEIYAENDDRIGIDFQSWKNNEGVDLFSAGTFTSRNWGTFFASGVQDTGNNRVSYWNFNPKWNTRYLDFMTSIGKAKCLAQGVLVAQNRAVSGIQVNSGFFYDRTYYTAGAKSIPEACTEFTYTDPNPDTIQREAATKVMPYGTLTDLYREAGSNAVLAATGYTMRMMGTQTGTNIYGDVTAKLTGNDLATDKLAQYLTGYVKADGTVVNGTYYNTDGNYMKSSPGIVHGWLQYPMVTNGFRFDLKITPVVTGQAAKVKFDLSSISLIGWNSDGSARTSKSDTSTTVQIGYEASDFVIGGLRKSESVRSTTGLPYFKDLPVLGRILSTESESIKQSQLVLIASVEYSNPDDFAGAQIQENLGKIVKGVNKGMTSRVGNMFFQQYCLDDDREPRNDRLDAVGNMISDEYKEIK
ncbi:MAG: hypothetical protein PHI35_06715 [Victivallaceae bacterium]|nr:hypothetical protein [Victivallaceae bacterium]